MMKFSPLKIPDVILIVPDVHRDERGFFFETYQEEKFVKNGVTSLFVQDNHSKSMKGVLRGLHFQREPHAQAKLIRVIRGEIFDVVVDIRKNSPSFGRHASAYLSEENRNMLYVPKGFAHGYCVLQDHTEVLYKVSSLYAPKYEAGLLWKDPKLGIPWPKLDIPYALNARDEKYPLLEELKLD